MKVLKVKIGERVMLKMNVDVSDGLAGGIWGEVKNIVVDSKNFNTIKAVLVQFLHMCRKSKYYTAYTSTLIQMLFQ